MSNWWANKIATAPRPASPLPGPPMGGNPYPPAPFQPAPQAPQHPVETYDPDPTTMAGLFRNKFGMSMWDWQGNPRGGAGETQRVGSCPACGSPRYFSKSGQTVTNSNTGVVATPRPECMECGYPNEQGALGVPVASQGPVRAARGAEAPVPGGTIGHLRRQ